MVFKNFKSIRKEFQNNLFIRVHDELPTVSALMSDNKDGTIEILMYGWETDKRIVMKIKYDGAAKDWKQNLDAIWNKSTNIDTDEMIMIAYLVFRK